MTDARVLSGRDPATGAGMRVVVEGGTVTDVRPGDGDGPWIAPGLVDLQVNGHGGHDVNAAHPDPSAISAITADLRAVGVTTWVPTVVTASEDDLCARLDAVTTAVREDPAVAAAVPFVHVEGPFLSSVDGARGVHDARHVRPIDAAEVRRWSRHARIGYVTVSPHDDAAPEQIAEIVADGVAVAIGHTHAAPDAIARAVEAGASLSTHLGNGIAAELPRHPNAIWTQLADDRLRCGLIGDGHHLPADTVTAMVRALGEERAFLVSDAVELAGAAPGRYRTTVGGEVVLSSDGRLEYAGTGYLAGSAVSLADCLRWVVRATPLGLGAAVRLASTSPGVIVEQLSGGSSRPGRIAVGERADLVLLADDGSVLAVVAPVPDAA